MGVGDNDVLALVTQTEMSAFVKQDADVLVGELVAEAVFIGVVHPLGHPDERFGLGYTRRVLASYTKKKWIILFAQRYKYEWRIPGKGSRGSDLSAWRISRS